MFINLKNSKLFLSVLCLKIHQLIMMVALLALFVCALRGKYRQHIANLNYCKKFRLLISLINFLSLKIPSLYVIMYSLISSLENEFYS